MTQPLAPILPNLTGYSIVFDLDGTLVDTAPDLIGATNHVLTRNGRPVIDEPVLRSIVGHGAKALIERAFAVTGEPIDDAALPEQVGHFLSYYNAHIADFSKPFPGIEQALARLAKAGAGLSICTNKTQMLAENLIATLGLTGYFPVIVGGDVLDVHKPDPQHYFETIARMKGTRERSLLVGDSPTDATTARNAKVPFIGVTFGYTPVPPEEFGADVLISHFDALDAAIARIAG